MNVLHLCLSFAEGGRRRAVTTLLQHLPDYRVRCDLACLDDLGCPKGELDGLAGEVEVLNRRSTIDFRAIRRLRRLCRLRSIDIVHAHDAASHFLAATARLGRRRPRLLMTFHRSLGFESASVRDRLRNAFAIRQSDAILTASRERRDHFVRENFISPRKVVRIPLGIDLNRFRADPEARAAIRDELGLDPETIVLGAAGHFGEEKGLDVVIRGFSALALRHDSGPLALIVVGDGSASQRDRMQELARQAAPGRVIFAGFCRDIERWFAAFDLFVHAPRMEAFGLVLAEAMAVGLPVIATRVGGIPDLIREGQTGVLVPADSPNAVADAIRQLIRDRHTMGEAARQIAQAEYGAELYASRHVELYSDLLTGRPPRGCDAPI